MILFCGVWCPCEVVFVKMKTSYSQFQIMVEFMERYGDLSKPSGGPRGRHWCNKKWAELGAKLNSDGTGDSRTDEKWRKVWSDLKNNTKRKAAKINRSMKGTGGGPALKICLTDLEQRVMSIVGDQAATGLHHVPEVGFEQDSTGPEVDAEHHQAVGLNLGNVYYGDALDWNLPSTSTAHATVEETTQEISFTDENSVSILVPPLEGAAEQAVSEIGGNADVSTHSQPQLATTQEPKWKPPPKKAKKGKVTFSKADTAAAAFLENERARDKIYLELENERIRQRDAEISLQRDWLQFLRDALSILQNFLEKKQQQE